MNVTAQELELDPYFFDEFKKALFKDKDYKKMLRDKVESQIPDASWKMELDKYIDYLEDTAMYKLRIEANDFRYSYVLKNYEQSYNFREKHKTGLTVVKVFAFLIVFLIVLSIGIGMGAEDAGVAAEVVVFILAIIAGLLPSKFVNKMADDSTHNYHGDARTVVDQIEDAGSKISRKLLGCVNKMIEDPTDVKYILTVEKAENMDFGLRDYPRVFFGE